VDDLPHSLRLPSAFPFVGRAAELEALHALVPTADGEGGRVALVGGEPGCGKSRLVRELAGRAAGEGVLVLYGACDAVVHTPYGPFVEALGHLARVSEPAELREALGTAGGELTRLLPDLATRVGDLPPPVRADPDTERHRLHTAVAELLAAVGRRRPVLLVLEDGHWADAPTLQLLRHLARDAGGARVLLLATFRDAEADVPEALADVLADLRRSEAVVRLRLGGLSGDEVGELVRRAAGDAAGPVPPELPRAMSELTDGNAFLVCELWRALVETRAVELTGGAIRLTRPLSELGTPESVREVVSRRLSRLAPETTGILELAATAGAEFELEVVRRAAGLEEPELLAALDEAARSGMIEELPARALAYRFTHELVRRALYDRLPRARRAELHLRVGEALEGAGERFGRAVDDLAHHFAAAAPFGGAARGVAYNLRSADAAMAALAFDEAAARLRTALELGIDRPHERADAYLRLGTARHRAGKAGEALEAFTAAADIARGLGDSELLARAASGFEEACWRPGIAEAGVVELLEEAAAALGDEDSELRVEVLGGLARALNRRGDHERGAVVHTNAVAMARRRRDRAGLATVLARSYWSRGTSSLEEVLGMLTEARQLAAELGDTELLAEAMAWRVPALVALCDVDAARREVAALRRTAERTAQPFRIHVAEHYRSALALGDGRLEDAERFAWRSHEWSRLLTGRDASGVHGIQMFSVRREQGRLAELAPVVRILAGGDARDGPWRPGLVSLLVELGMEREARRELERVAADGLDGFRESLWLASLTYLADACTALGDETVAALVLPALEPHAGSNVMIGHLVAWYGAADRYLGMLAATLGDDRRAERHLEQAMALERRMGARTWLAHSAYELARVLLARGAGERARAGALLGEAAALAEQIGMPVLLGRIRALGSSLPAAAPPAGLSHREVQILGLVAGGLSNREIGRALFISEHTAANHVRSILRKTGCANRTEAASYAHRHGLVNA
jgi:DNA-binding CsgD family transcriptional regulator/tetratricopeptide (TPR) repeat protein